MPDCGLWFAFGRYGAPFNWHNLRGAQASGDACLSRLRSERIDVWSRIYYSEMTS
jgi:hypothetical protein